MNKVSLLAASVALALTGCGGSDDSGSAPGSPGGIIITGFDGYFNQAVAFQDTNNNGELDFDTETGKVKGDILFGLTDANGKIEVTGDKVPAQIKGSLALQTITPGGLVQTLLATAYPNEYAGKYTIDMDHPAQAMAHELVFRTPVSSDTSSHVISPITDLVILEMKKSGVSEKVAIETVNEALGGTEEAPIDLYSDFVAGDEQADNELHKTAQILTESKAANPETYEEKSTEFAEKADEIVDAIVADQNQDITDPNLKPVIIDDNGTLTPIVNNKMLVDAGKLASLNEELTKLNQIEEDYLSIALDLTDLFTDIIDTSESIVPTLSKSTKEELDAANITVEWSGSTLTLYSDLVTSSANISIILEAIDFDSSDPAIDSGTVAAELVLNIEALNEAPILDMDEFLRLQKIIDGWQLLQGQEVNQTLDITSLFIDSDGNIVEFRSGGMTADGLSLPPESSANPIITITGSPTKAYEKYTTSFNVGVVDDDGASAYIEFLLPEIQGQSIGINDDAIKLTQNDITTTLGELKVGEPLTNNSFYIVDLFDTTNVSGTVGYYAGLEFDLENHEYQTSVPGVTVDVDTNGTLRISGTPTSATNDAYFFIAAGVNPDAEDGVESEMVRLALPNVQPEDDTGTPEPTPELGFTQAHFEKAGVWKMGSFDNGDAEVAYASMRVIDGVNQFCFATKDFNPDNSLSNGLWNDALVNLDNKTDDEIETDILASCDAVTLHQDGSISIPMENENETITISMFYQNVTESSDYQIIIEATDPQSNSIDELFWLDSSDTLFASFSYPEAKHEYTEYMIVDDGSKRDELRPLLSFSTYTEVNDIDDEETLINGTYTAESITEPSQWGGLWSVKELFPTGLGAQYLEIPEFNEDVDREVIRRHFTYRNFGDINIGITDNDKDNAIDKDGVFYLTSDNQEVITAIDDAWRK